MYLVFIVVLRSFLLQNTLDTTSEDIFAPNCIIFIHYFFSTKNCGGYQFETFINFEGNVLFVFNLSIIFPEAFSLLP